MVSWTGTQASSSHDAPAPPRVLVFVIVLFQLHDANAIPARPPSTVTPATNSNGDTVFLQSFVKASCLFNEWEEYQDWMYTDAEATPEACAEECLKYDECTGFELFSGGSPYCSLWFNGACAHEHMAYSTDVTTAVLMDGVARFMDSYCIWYSDTFKLGVDYVVLPDQMTWSDCLEMCFATDPSYPTSSTTTSNTTTTTTTTTTIAATTAAMVTAAFGLLNGTNVTDANTTTTVPVDPGVCTGIEAKFSSDDDPVLDTCALYYGGACVPDQLSQTNDLPYDTVRLYDLEAIEPSMAEILGLEEYNIDTLQDLPTTVEGALLTGYAACNPGAEILRGYQTCDEYVDSFACDCDEAFVGDLCVGNTTVVPLDIWVTALVLPAGASCSSEIGAEMFGETFTSCRSRCYSDTDCSCFIFTLDATRDADDASSLGICQLMTGGPTSEATAWPDEEGSQVEYYTYMIDASDTEEVTLASVCPTQCSLSVSCEEQSQWTVLTIVFLCCLIFAVLALVCAVGKWIHNMVMHRRRRQQAQQERAALAMSPESIGTIEVEVFDPDKWEEGHGDPECIICLGDFEKGDKLRKLKCHHRFHVACIDEWLKQQGLCPICKVDLRPPEDQRPRAGSAGSTGGGGGAAAGNDTDGPPARHGAGGAGGAGGSVRDLELGDSDDGSGGNGGGGSRRVSASASPSPTNASGDAIVAPETVIAGGDPGSLSPPARRSPRRRAAPGHVEVEMRDMSAASAGAGGSARRKAVDDADDDADGVSERELSDALDGEDEEDEEERVRDSSNSSTGVRSTSSEPGSAQVAIAP